jgi:hypothetical protein
MKTYVLNIKKAAFGWPIYTACNLAAYTFEAPGWPTRAFRLVFSLLFFVLTTAAWAALWIFILWLPIRLALMAADSS